MYIYGYTVLRYRTSKMCVCVCINQNFFPPNICIQTQLLEIFIQPNYLLMNRGYIQRYNLLPLKQFNPHVFATANVYNVECIKLIIMTSLLRQIFLNSFYYMQIKIYVYTGKKKSIKSK